MVQGSWGQPETLANCMPRIWGFSVLHLSFPGFLWHFQVAVVTLGSDIWFFGPERWKVFYWSFSCLVPCCNSSLGSSCKLYKWKLTPCQSFLLNFSSHPTSAYFWVFFFCLVLCCFLLSIIFRFLFFPFSFFLFLRVCSCYLQGGCAVTGLFHNTGSGNTFSYLNK